MQRLCYLIIGFFLAFSGSKVSANQDTNMIMPIYGTASWYGGRHAGRITANGEIFNPHADTCAHRSLPFNSLLRITAVETGKSTICRVNDRGPFAVNRHHHFTRILDATEFVAAKLGFKHDGITKIEIVPIEVAEVPSATHQTSQPKKKSHKRHHRY